MVKDNLILIQPNVAVDYSFLINTVKPPLQEFLKLTFRPPR
jgi:hypothetical protein